MGEDGTGPIIARDFLDPRLRGDDTKYIGHLFILFHEIRPQMLLDGKLSFKYIVCMIYSKHALIRMKERSISPEEVNEIINNVVDIVKMPSKREKGVFIILGITLLGKDIAVVLNERTRTIITLRRMRKEERKIFKEAVK